MARESGWWDCRHSMFGWRGVNRCGRRAIRDGATLAEISPCCCLRKFLELYEALRTEKDFKTNRVAALARLTGWAFMADRATLRRTDGRVECDRSVLRDSQGRSAILSKSFGTPRRAACYRTARFEGGRHDNH